MSKISYYVQIVYNKTMKNNNNEINIDNEFRRNYNKFTLKTFSKILKEEK